MWLVGVKERMMMRLSTKGRLVLLLTLVIFSASSLMAEIYAPPVLKGRTEINVSYGDGRNLDIYHPVRQVGDLSPVLIYVHGGAWIVGDKIMVNNGHFNLLIKKLREEGWTIISPNYKLAKYRQSPFPDAVDDIYSAVDWVYQHAAEYNFDTTTIGYLGQSAGAHLAMLAAFAPDSTRHQPAFVIDAFGPTDLFLLHEKQPDFKVWLDHIAGALMPEGQQRERLLMDNYILGFDPSENPELAERIFYTLSPLNHLSKATPPVCILHGESDNLVRIEHSERLQTSLSQLGVRHRMYRYSGVGHAFSDMTRETKFDMQERVYGFIQEVLVRKNKSIKIAQDERP